MDSVLSPVAVREVVFPAHTVTGVLILPAFGVALQGGRITPKRIFGRDVVLFPEEDVELQFVALSPRYHRLQVPVPSPVVVHWQDDPPKSSALLKQVSITRLSVPFHANVGKLVTVHPVALTLRVAGVEVATSPVVW